MHYSPPRQRRSHQTRKVGHKPLSDSYQQVAKAVRDTAHDDVARPRSAWRPGLRRRMTAMPSAAGSQHQSVVAAVADGDDTGCAQARHRTRAWPAPGSFGRATDVTAQVRPCSCERNAVPNVSPVTTCTSPALRRVRSVAQRRRRAAPVPGQRPVVIANEMLEREPSETRYRDVDHRPPPRPAPGLRRRTLSARTGRRNPAPSPPPRSARGTCRSW